MTFQDEVEELALGGVEDAPPLHLAREHRDRRVEHAVDRVEDLGAWVEGLGLRRVGDRCRHLEVVVQLEALDHHDLLLGRLDLRHLVDLAAHDDHACHATTHLLGHCAVAVRVVPEEPALVIRRHLDLVVVRGSGLNGDEDVVTIALGGHVHAMRVEVGGRPFVGAVVATGGGRYVKRREIVDEVHAAGLAGPQLPRRAGQHVVVGEGRHRLGRSDVDHAGHRRQREGQRVVVALQHCRLA